MTGTSSAPRVVPLLYGLALRRIVSGTEHDTSRTTLERLYAELQAVKHLETAREARDQAHADAAELVAETVADTATALEARRFAYADLEHTAAPPPAALGPPGLVAALVIAPAGPPAHRAAA